MLGWADKKNDLFFKTKKTLQEWIDDVKLQEYISFEIVESKLVFMLLNRYIHAWVHAFVFMHTSHTYASMYEYVYVYVYVRACKFCIYEDIYTYMHMLLN